MSEPEKPVTVASGAKADYGIDAPSVVLTFLAIGIFALFASVFAAGGNAPSLVIFFLIWTVMGLGTAGYMVYASKKGKRALWERTLDGLELAGDERALDVGCGRGLVMIETAKRLPRGKATGIDVWRSRDQSGNARVVTEANAAAEHVSERIEIHDGDMRKLPFDDDSFDLVTASLAIHNLRERADRDASVREIARVLAPDGRVVIIDIAKIHEYREVLEAEGIAIELTSKSFGIYPPVKTVVARKVEN